MTKFLTLIICLMMMNYTYSQSVRLLTAGTQSSFRGLSVVDDQTIWVSGSKGMVGRSEDGGINWIFQPVMGFEKKEFRDIEAFDAKKAIIMSIDTPGIILMTKDGGTSWTKVYENHTAGMFFDAMEFWNTESGIIIGDPIEGRFFVIRTFDGGEHWQEVPFENRPVAEKGEACFASSGTNIRALSKGEAVFVSGGNASHVFIKENKIKLPLAQGKESMGANSIAVKNKKTFMIVGGDFNKKDSITGNITFTKNAGKTWIKSTTPPHGYRSCVEYLGRKKWITCGINGIDITKDNGITFEQISQTGFHACRKAKKGKKVFFAGGGGKIGVLED